MSRLGPYNQRQIDGDFVLTELQKLYKKSDPVKFKLTPRYNAFGDSYGATSFTYNWVGQLNLLCGAVANNRCVSGDSLDQMLLNGIAGQSNPFALMKNPIFDCSSIIMYGVNDARRTQPFFNYYSSYYNTALASYLMASIPQSGLRTADEGTVISGTWVAGSSSNSVTDIRTDELNAKISIELSGRFLAVFFAVSGNTGDTNEKINNPWKISVNGFVESEMTRNYFVSNSSATSFYIGVRVIDTRVPGTLKTLLLENLQTAGNSRYLWGFGGWDADSPLARNVLLATPTTINIFDVTGGTTLSETQDEIHLKQKDAQIAAAEMCKALGLPVFIHNTPYETEFDTDAVHLNENGITALASKMLTSIDTSLLI